MYCVFVSYNFFLLIRKIFHCRKMENVSILFQTINGRTLLAAVAVTSVIIYAKLLLNFAVKTGLFSDWRLWTRQIVNDDIWLICDIQIATADKRYCCGSRS